MKARYLEGCLIGYLQCYRSLISRARLEPGQQEMPIWLRGSRCPYRLPIAWSRAVDVQTIRRHLQSHPTGFHHRFLTGPLVVEGGFPLLRRQFQNGRSLS